jgi:phosphoribosylaminoimidazole-succinocarboxamide synthase
MATFPPATLDDIDLDLPDRREGKVRVSYALPGRPHERLFVTTDRLSAFDRIITCVPCKGQVLNQLSAWWFDQTREVVANHLIAVPDPAVTVARNARPLPVEVVVRGYITGVTSTSLWQRYSAGARLIDGHRLPDGLRKNSRLPEAIITPTTKAHAGGHDEPLSVDDVVRRELVDADLWARVCATALELFALGQRVAERSGLILADTKYEFGLDAHTGALLVIDELHTPDSSRFWLRDSYLTRLDSGDEPESLDKELVRRALADLGFRGDGPVPDLGADVVAATSARYVDIYELLTGERFVPARQPAQQRIAAAVTAWLDGHPTMTPPTSAEGRSSR